MRSIHTWLAEYGESHRDPTNKLIHWICVPLIVLSLIGLLWSIPVPEAFGRISPVLNWGMLFLLLALVYYFVLSIPLGLGMAVFSALVVLGVDALQSLPWPLWQSCLAIFVAAWIGQFVGHRIEGRKPSFFKDLQFLLIGPAWLLAFLYRKLRIAY